MKNVYCATGKLWGIIRKEVCEHGIKIFHGDNDCSGMTPAGQVTVAEAKNMGYESCQKCAKYID